MKGLFAVLVLVGAILFTAHQAQAGSLDSIEDAMQHAFQATLGSCRTLSPVHIGDCVKMVQTAYGMMAEDVYMRTDHDLTQFWQVAAFCANYVKDDPTVISSLRPGLILICTGDVYAQIPRKEV